MPQAGKEGERETETDRERERDQSHALFSPRHCDIYLVKTVQRWSCGPPPLLGVVCHQLP